MQQAKRRRGARATAAGSIIGLLAGLTTLVPVRATASPEPPETAVTTAGQSLAVEITTPSSPARVEAPGTVSVGGTATIGAPQPTPLHAAFVVDLSGSTGGTTAYDCNGNGITDAGDDFNGSGGGFGQLVDCAIAGVLAINGGLVERGSTDVAVVGFAERAAVADMQATTGDQPFTASLNDSAAPAPGDVETVARSLRPNTGSASIDQYTARSGLGSSGQFAPAIRSLVDTMAARPESEERVAFLMADGAPADTAPLPIADLSAASIKVNTFAIGPSASCAAGSALASIAAATGGACTRIASPAAFTSVVAQAATIAAVEYSVDGGGFAPVTSFDPASGAFTLELPIATLGDQTVRVRARAADGTMVQSMLELTGVDAPDVASEVLATAEGTPLPLAGSATDGDHTDAELAFAWTPDDGRVSSTTTEDTTFLADDDGTFTYTLTATDPDGLSGSGTKQITVANVAPTIGTVTAPSPVNEGAASAFSVQFSDPGTADSHEVRFSWGDGTADDIVTVDERVATHTVNATHTYAAGSGDPTLVVTVTDDDGGRASTEQVIDINHGPTATLDEGAYSVTEGGTVTISSSFADVDLDALTGLLSVGGTPVASEAVGNGGTLSAVVGPPATADEGTIDVASQASDSFGLVGGDTATLTVLNADPVITDFAVPSETLPGVPVPVAVSGALTDAGTNDTHTVSVDWDGDGPGGFEPGTTSSAGGAGTFSASHTYASFGTYAGTLRLCDTDGGCTERSFTIAVGTPPVADAGADASIGEGSSVTLAGSATDADTSGGEQLTYQWSPADGPADGFLMGAGTATPSFSGVDDGVFTYVLQVCDSQGACGSDSVTITVSNVAPSSLSLNVSEDPANGDIRLAVDWTDPGAADASTLVVDWGDTSAPESFAYGAGVTEALVTHAFAGAGSYEITVAVTDDDGGGASTTTTATVVDNVAPTITGITGPAAPVPVGTTSSVQVSFDDPDPADTHEVELDWDDRTPVSTVTMAASTAGTPQASATHVYTTPGVYTVTATVRDREGATSEAAVFEYVVAYDPTAGFVTGAGSIMSPEGAYSLDPVATGKATFGIASKYQKGSNVPSGETEFQFKAGGFEFQSTANEYLVISGAKATYRGVGNVNGASGYSFQVTVVDGAKTNTADRFRIKIWQGNQGNPVYDNERGSLDSADPTTAISTGSIVIHKA